MKEIHYKSKSKILLITFAIIGLSCNGQISLDQCIQGALNSHPSLKSEESLGLINELELANNRIQKYPGLLVGAQGKYQSDVVALDIESPFGDIDFPEIPHFQYNLNLNASQIIYDGGKREMERDLIMVDYKQNLAVLDAKEREIKERVELLYLQILLKAKQGQVIKSLQNSLEAVIVRLEAGYRGGVVSELDLEQVKAERIDLNRKLLSVEKSRISNIQHLAKLCNMVIGDKDEFLVPIIDFHLLDPNRAEYDIIDYRVQSLEIRKEMLGLKTTPRLSAFGQAGYGRPGLNFMSDKWQDFYIAGLQLSWVPWDYRETKRKQAIIDINSQMLVYEREAFDLRLQSSIINILNRISLSEDIIKEDEKMVAARESIRQTMEKRLEEGDITSSEFIIELNREQQARLDLEKSKLELIANQLAYQVINGK